MPRPSDKRVRVRHTSGAEKSVHPSQLGSLSSRWEPVVDAPRKTRRRRTAAVADDPITPPAVEPENSQEG